MNLYLNPTISTLLESIAEELDIPPALYEEAVLHYSDVGDWLGAHGSPLEKYRPEIYPQGSFRLGTVVRPIRKNGEFDIDLVCRISKSKDQTTQAELKHLVGDRLKDRADLQKRIEECRRCWRLNYEPRLHMDVLPCLPNPERLPNGIILTDKALHHWQSGNPIDYANWFHWQMKTAFDLKRQALALSMQAAVEDVREWQVKTPLQRVVQVLKRHRDLSFKVDDNNAPVSIIITTLAAHAYKNQLDIQEALHAILSNMDGYISYENGRWWVRNPAEPNENFADKWNEEPERRKAFHGWLEKARRDFGLAVEQKSLADTATVLGKILGTGEVGRALARLNVEGGALVARPAVFKPLEAPGLASESHVQRTAWREDISHSAKIKASTYTANKKTKLAALGDYAIAKNTQIRFDVSTSVKGAYTVKWQVVNTGQEAYEANQLRGDFYESDDQHYRWERAGYGGTHWVQAFVLKDGICVARTEKKFVRVRC
jgi:hypothetical protein